MICILKKLQVDDLEARKCREGRLFYPGPLSFLFIAIPMTLILFNEFLGDSIVDAIIPSVYSGLMLLGVSLYNISLITFLITLCIITGMLGYLSFIFFPARHAYLKRLEKLNQSDAQVVTHSRSRYSKNNNRRPLNGLSFYTEKEGYFGRLYRDLKHTIQYTVTYTSFYYVAQERQRKQREIIQWRDMNMILSHQGFVQEVSREDYNDALVQEARHRRSNFSPNSSSASSSTFPSTFPPSSIQRTVDMNMPTELWHLDPKLNESMYSKKVDNKDITSDEKYEIDDRDEDEDEDNYYGRVITKSCNKKQRMLMPSALYDSTIAMNNMRLLFHPEGLQVDEHVKDLDVPLLDLKLEFINLLTFFAPDGILMTEIERSEAVDSFNKWKESRMLRIKISRICGEIVHTQMINFYQFEEWFKIDFLNAMHGIVVDRFIDHTLQYQPHVKKRIAKSLLSL